MIPEEIKKLVDEYKFKKGHFEDFALRVKSIIEEILDIEAIDHLSLEARGKAIDSLERKLEDMQIKRLEDVHDLSGVRIVAYVKNDVDKIENIIQKNFNAKQLKVDERLGIDKVGYRSEHWLISFTEDRLKLPEYQRFKGFNAELQIRTILQHAWAQIGHKQIYKPSAILPEKIERDFTLLSGLLEIADNEFNRISHEIIKYQEEVVEKTEKGNLETKIDSISLRQYFDSRFKPYANPKFGPKDDMVEKIIDEFTKMEVTTLAKLEGIIPSNFIENLVELEKESNYCGLARNIMIIYDKDKYFKEVWNNSWVFNPKEDGLIYRKYGIDIQKIKEVYGVGKTKEILTKSGT